MRALRKDASVRITALKRRHREAARILDRVSAAAEGSWRQVKRSADVVLADAVNSAAALVKRLEERAPALSLRACRNLACRTARSGAKCCGAASTSPGGLVDVAARIALVFGVLTLASQVFAQSTVIYPAKGQSAAQQSKDEGECQIWAKQNTGIDPVALAGQASQPVVSAAPRREEPALKGAAVGAAGGAAVGAISGGDAGKGAAAGAVAGTAVGGHQKRKASRDSEAAGQQAQAAQSSNVQSQLATFNKAYSACLEGRGYTVK